MSRCKQPPLNVPCELKSQFCNGKDVRRIQKIWHEDGRMVRGSYHHWCKGCRAGRHGGYRYPQVGDP